MISLVEFVYYFTFKLFQNFDEKREKLITTSMDDDRKVVPFDSKSKLTTNNNGINIKTNIHTVQINVSDQFYANYAKRHGSYLH